MGARVADSSISFRPVSFKLYERDVSGSNSFLRLLPTSHSGNFEGTGPFIWFSADPFGHFSDVTYFKLFAHKLAHTRRV